MCIVTFFLWLLGMSWLMACQATPSGSAAAVPTLMSIAIAENNTATPVDFVPPTYTAQPLNATLIPSPSPTRADAATPTVGFLPTNTPIPPTLTPSITPTPTITPSPTVKPLEEYRLDEPLPVDAYPRPLENNGWGMHWIPTVKQEPAVVDRFVGEMVRMHIKWVVFLNDGTNIGDNDYLVDRLVANGIMPVMRLYRSNVTVYEGDIGALVRHYRAKGVYYYQLYNEPNVNEENNQGRRQPQSICHCLGSRGTGSDREWGIPRLWFTESRGGVQSLPLSGTGHSGVETQWRRRGSKSGLVIRSQLSWHPPL